MVSSAWDFLERWEPFKVAPETGGFLRRNGRQSEAGRDGVVTGASGMKGLSERAQLSKLGP